MDFILSLDLGTTSVRAVIFDANNKAVSSAEKELSLYHPNPGWVEQDPIEMIEKQIQVVKLVLEKTDISNDKITAIGITNQRETCILWDKKTGKPYGNAIVWQDRRTSDLCKAMIRNGESNFVYEKTGLIIDPYFSASKISWMLNNSSDLRRKAAEGKVAFGTVDSWLLWNLTDKKIHVTDGTNASRTMLYNIHELDWDEELLELWKIPRTLLPEVIPTAGEYGTTSILTGTSVPITAVAGDQQAALFGQMCFTPGTIKCTYGTGCFALMNTGDNPVSTDSGLLTTIAYKSKSSAEYALEGSVFMGGATIQWLRDGIEIINSSEEVEALASSVKDTNGIVFVPAFTGLGAPYWDPSARGMIIGLNRETNKYHIARAALEGVAWLVSDMLDSMSQTSDIKFDHVRVDGGASVNNMLMQLQANFLQTRIHRSKNKEITALGASLLAKLGMGIYESREDIKKSLPSNDLFEPNINQSNRDKQHAVWARAIERSSAWTDN